LPVWDTVVALHDAGYNGMYDVELMGAEIEVACYEQLLADTHRAFSTELPSAVFAERLS
jgi:hypothetical protein